MKKLLTLVLVHDEERVLLGMKKRGFGAGRYNGFGGKLEEGETIEAAAIRECEEESGITPCSLDRAGVLKFSFAGREDALEVHVFAVAEFSGQPKETEEMRPEWFLWDDVPFDLMWADDRHWFPYFRSGRFFSGAFHFDTPATAENPGEILKYSLFED
jgi:8-oxo-dGTP pyrophosphatase MutT (NUDIX family)